VNGHKYLIYINSKKICRSPTRRGTSPRWWTGQAWFSRRCTSTALTPQIRSTNGTWGKCCWKRSTISMIAWFAFRLFLTFW